MRRNRNRNKSEAKEFKEVKPKLTLLERQALHQEKHPNDKNVRKEGKGVTWSKETEKDKQLKQFYKTHVWTSYATQGWIALPIEGEEE